MKITVKLSDASIRHAIRRLRQAQDHLRWGLNDTVDILTKNGEAIAQNAYGSMANVVGYMQDETVGIIATSGKANLIAEFGAGDDTDPATGFENPPDTPVYAGSYSELEGSGDYAEKGYWYFGGVKYYGGGPGRVEPRRGLMQAKVYILEEGTDIARRVIKL